MSEDSDIAASVERHGWHAIRVQDHEPPFTYTIGLCASMNHPEIVVLGRDAETAYGLLRDMVAHIRSGRVYTPGTRQSDLLEGCPVELRPVDGTQLITHFGYAFAFYRNAGKPEVLRAVQLVWPDHAGKLPGDPGCDPEVVRRQPLLDSPVAEEELDAFFKENLYWPTGFRAREKPVGSEAAQNPRTLGERLGLRAPLAHIRLTPLRVEELRARAPGVVNALGAYTREPLEPTPGGVFDEAIFGPGATLEHRRADEDAPVTRERTTRFGRILLVEGVPNPLLPGETIAELPVLPPDLRPIVLRDGKFLSSDVNELYRQVLVWNGRLSRLRELDAPLALVDDACANLARAVAAVIDNERLPEPSSFAGRTLGSLRRVLMPDVDRAIATLDEAAGHGADLAGPLPLKLHRTVATLLAMNLVVEPAVLGD